MQTVKFYTAMLLLMMLSIGSKVNAQCTSASIVTQPSNSTVCQGVSNTFFSVVASGTTLNYQWQMWTGANYSNISDNAVFSGTGTSVLIVSNPSLAMDGTFYRCQVTAACGLSVVTNQSILFVNGQHVITSNPQSQTICDGGNTSFSVGATATTVSNVLSYQWQMDGGTGFADIPNGGAYSGVNTATLNVTGANSTMNGDVFRCEVSSLCGIPVASTHATLGVRVPVSISSQPANQTVCPSAGASFAVGATGTSGDPIFYQWQVNTGSGFNNIPNVYPYSGMNGANLTITQVTNAMNGYTFRCVVNGSCAPSVTSNAATLSLFSIPAIATQPVNATICVNTNTSFSVAATGTGLLYEWQIFSGGVWTTIPTGYPYAGIYTNNLTITNVSASFNGNSYRCMVSGTCAPAVASNIVGLTVNSSPAIVTQPPATIPTCSNPLSNNITITASGAGIAYQWQGAPGNGTFTNLTNGPAFTGVNTSTLTFTGLSAAIYHGYTVRCVVSGTCAPPITSANSVFNFFTAPSLMSHPANAEICAGANTTFNTTANGTNLTYQWYVLSGVTSSPISNGGVYSGATTASLTITGATTALSGNKYYCVVSGTCSPSVQTNNANLTVNELPVINTQPISTTVCANVNATFSIGAVAGVITYQWQVNTGSGFTNITNGAPYTGMNSAVLTVINPQASQNGYTYRCLVGSFCGPVLTSSTVTLNVNTAPAIVGAPANSTVCAGSGTSFATAATGTAIGYQWQLNAGTGFANVTNGGIYSGATTATLGISGTTAAMNGYVYRVVVSGTCAPPAISADAVLTVNTAPVINVHPVNTAVCQNSNTSLNVNASGTALTYQWQVNTGSGYTSVANGGTYSGATTATLSFTTTPLSFNTYTYRCVISGTCPSTIISNPATLTVNGLPTIASNPTSAVACANTNISFTVGATGATLTYQWQVNTGSGFTNIISNPPYNGNNGATLTIINTPLSYNGYTYRCVVGGTCAPSQISAPATLTVNSLPAITAQPVAASVCAGLNTSFSTTATGTGIGYQWQISSGSTYANLSNGGFYSGVNTSTLSITGATTTLNTKLYRCVVLGSCAPAAITNPAMLTVNIPPSINVQPTDQTVCVNTTVFFNVNGNASNYQWEWLNGTVWTPVISGGDYSFTNTNQMRIYNVNTSMRGMQFRCVLSTPCLPNIITNTVTLTVYSSPTVLTQPINDTTCVSTNASFSFTVDGKDMTYQWEELSGTSGGWQPLVNTNVYQNVYGTNLTFANVPQSLNGNSYRCKITSPCGIEYTQPRVLFVDPAPVITYQPQQLAANYKGLARFRVVAVGRDLTYQWQADTIINGNRSYMNISNNAFYSGVNDDTLVINPAGGYMNGKMYRCIVSGLCSPSVTSNGVGLSLFFSSSVANINGNEVDMNIYPNPVNGNTLNIMLSGNYNGRNVLVKVTNNMGSLVANENVTLMNNTGSINVANLAAGVYNLHVADSDNNTLKVIRFVKQ